MTLRALIADDEPELVRELDRQLRLLWPEMAEIVHAANGEQALRCLEKEQPHVAFLDIRMPGLSGLEVARQSSHRCHWVFVTAFDHYAIEAFEREAVDYLLKPVREQRLQATITRLQQRLNSQPPRPDQLASLLARVDQLLTASPEPPLQWVQASVGERIRLIATEDIHFLRAEDKYTQVHTRDGEFPIRTPLKELEPRLNPEYFWRIHRNCIINARYVQSVSRDFRGRCNVVMQNSHEPLLVSRSYAQRFRPS